MTTDKQMRQARILALKAALEALEQDSEVCGPSVYSGNTVRDHLFNTEELSESQKCAVGHIFEALDAAIQGNEVLQAHPGFSCRELHKGR